MTESEESLLHAIAARVADVVLNGARAEYGRELGMGADGTPTKMVDDLAEREILRMVAESKEPRLNVLSEEAGFVDHGAPRTLVVDPIDGTTNAARGIPLYCVSLAIGTRRLSDVTLGLVRNVPTGDVYLARKGAGATRNGHPIRVRALDPEDVLVATEPGPAARRLASRDRVCLRSFGSAALEMCFVAEGALDLYHMPQPKLRVIDVAASSLVVREAGGRVLASDGADVDAELTLAPRFALSAIGDARALAIAEALR